MENCPGCGSTSIYKSKKYGVWICEDCGEKFSEGVGTKKKWNTGLLADEFWEHSLVSAAPVSLSVSYQQLYNYVEEGNIGCTLFLVRDVFELMIKLPVVILMDGVYSVLERKEQPDEFLSAHPKLKSLYANSMQILTTGKWWECVRLGAGLLKEFKNEELFSTESESAYKETAEYLQKIYKMFWFQIPGQSKVNMVSWRNRAVGHSCLASNPEENYAEIPYILKMFKKIGAASVSYYQRVSFADSSKNILKGTHMPSSGEEIYVVFTGSEKPVFTKMHSFVVGKSENLAYFDGYEKGKAYLLNYADGDRYRDHRLSEYLEKMDRSGNGIILSESNIDADNLETADINHLEIELSSEEKVVHVTYLYNWLMEQIERHDKGIFLLQAERGMGKSTFCDTLDQLSASENVLRFSDEIDGWTDFMETSAIRVWHFNSTYFGRQDIYIPGIASALLTLSNGHFENKKWVEANRLVGRLESMWENLSACEEGLRHVYFAEALNATLYEYQARTENERIILVLDGLDEVTDIKTLMSYMPDSSELNSNIYLLFVSRTDMELADGVRELMKKKTITASLEFLRDKITVYENGTVRECLSGNEYYHNAIAVYIDNIFGDNSASGSQKLIERFDQRFSEFAAYKRLCKLNPVFKNTVDSDLLNVFIDVLKQNAPDTYLHKVEMILNALAWSGASLTIRELAYLSGEQYVSYRFIGMLYDLQAFIKVVRTENGNCYEFAHSEWETSVKEKYPYGAIFFRGLCNRLLDEIEAEADGKDFFSEENQGELWILANLMRLYNDSSGTLKENWFEDVKIDNIAAIWVNVLQKLSFDSELDVTTDLGRKVLSIVARVWDDYDTAIECFYYNEDRRVVCSVSNSAESQLAKVLLNGLSVKQTLSSMSEEDYYSSASICKSLGNIFDRIAIRHTDPEMKKKCALLADECYRQAGDLYNKGTDGSRLPDVIEMLYQSGRICQLGGLLDRAKEYFEAALKIIHNCSCVENSKAALYAARTCTRYGQLLDDPDRQFEYYSGAEKLLCDLIRKSCEAEYLEWRTWLYRLMAEWCGKRGQSKQAIVYWNAAFMDAEMLCDIRGSYEDHKDRIRAMEGLSESYINEKMWKEALPFLKMLVELEGKSVEYLRNLSQAYDNLQMYSEKKEIDARLLPLEEKKLEYANAYQEVLEILKYVSSEDYAKIPEQKITLFSQLANTKHEFRYDPDKTLDEQGTMKITKVIIAIIFRDYWAYDKQKAKIIEHEERDRAEYRVNLLYEVINQKCDYDEVTAVKLLENQYKSPVFNEVDFILQNIPAAVACCIPVITLSRIVKKKSSTYEKDLSTSGGNDYYQETVMIIKYLLKQYVPDLLLQEVKDAVPEDFDLSIIFDNEEYAD